MKPKKLPQTGSDVLPTCHPHQPTTGVRNENAPRQFGRRGASSRSYPTKQPQLLAAAVAAFAPAIGAVSALPIFTAIAATALLAVAGLAAAASAGLRLVTGSRTVETEGTGSQRTHGRHEKLGHENSPNDEAASASLCDETRIRSMETESVLGLSNHVALSLR